MFKWITKSELRSQLSYMTAKYESARSENLRLQDYIIKCEKLIDHERERIDSERNRADRLHDQINQQNGLLPVTDSGVAKSDLEDKAQEDAFTKQQKILSSLFAESMDDLEPDEEIQKNFIDPVQKLIISK